MKRFKAAASSLRAQMVAVRLEAGGFMQVTSDICAPA
jgi:hypothetical protein